MPLRPAVESSDERFWREQETRPGRRLGQPCCTLAGVSAVLSGLRGDFAVVVHGERDCLNCFVQYQGPSSAQFYCTNMSQVQFAAGKTAEPLRRCLDLLLRERRPNAVFVLGTCLTEMIHDDFDALAREVSQRTGVPILPMRTSGLKAGPQAEMLDWLFSTLASLSQERRPLPHPSAREREEGVMINLIGSPGLENGGSRRELDGILKQAGLELNGSFPYDVSFEDWTRLARASATFVADRSLYPRLLKRLEELDVLCHEVPLPIGLEQTTRFFSTIGRQFSREAQMQKALRPWVARCEKRLAGFRERYAGLRLALGLRMVNNYRTDQLAYDGLGDLAAFTEASFDVTLLIQGPTEESSRRRFQERLEQLGCRFPFQVFADPYDLPPLLRGGRFDAAYLADHARGEALQAGVPMLQSRSLEPFFGGAVSNLDYLESVLEQAGLGRRVR